MTSFQMRGLYKKGLYLFEILPTKFLIFSKWTRSWPSVKFNIYYVS